MQAVIEMFWQAVGYGCGARASSLVQNEKAPVHQRVGGLNWDVELIRQ